MTWDEEYQRENTRPFGGEIFGDLPMTTTYRVHMHTNPSPATTYYEGHVDVPFNRLHAGEMDDEERDEVVRRARRRACQGALHTGLVVDSIEEL